MSSQVKLCIVALSFECPGGFWSDRPGQLQRPPGRSLLDSFRRVGVEGWASGNLGLGS